MAAREETSSRTVSTHGLFALVHCSEAVSVANVRMDEESVILEGLHEEVATYFVLSNRVVINSNHIPGQRAIRDSGDELVR